MAATGTRGSNLSSIFMAVALLLMVGLMYWLNVQARATEVAVVEEDAQVDESAVALDVAVDTFGADPMAFDGTRVRLGPVVVPGVVGSTAFFIQIPGVNGQPEPYLIKMDSTLIADGMTVAVGDQLVVVGVVREMSEGVADQWVLDGVIAEGDKIIVTFAVNFLEASEVVLAGN